jgi:tRNA A37 methylthiotransferase MiaB
VPYTRGEEISRPPADVLAEVRALAAQGVGARMLEAAACTLGGLALARDLWAGPP